MAALYFWTLTAIDISTAFLQGEEYKDPRRRIHMKVDKELAELLRTYPGFKDFDEETEVLLLLKSAYGLVDAPKRWFESLTTSLRRLGWKQLVTDPAVYFHRSNGEFDGIVSLHVDDLKLAAAEGVRNNLLKELTTKFGALKVNENEFEHCGLMHVQRSDGSIELHQNHYVENIKEPDAQTMRLARKSPEKKLNTDHYGFFRTLLGQLAWLVQSRPEAAVIAAYLQGVANEPNGRHLLDAVLLLRWLKRHKSSTVFLPMSGPFRLLLFTDAAFKPEDVKNPSARRGDVLLLTSDNGKDKLKAHVLDYSSKRVARVTRSTFAAELQSMAAGIDQGIFASMVYEHLLDGTWNLTDREFDKKAANNSLKVPVDVLTDSWSLFQATKPNNQKIPDEKSLLLVLAAVREHLASKRVRKLGWIATTEMVADALSKATVARRALLDLCSRGEIETKTAKWHL